MDNKSIIKYKHSAEGLTEQNLVELWHGAGWEGYSDKHPKQLLRAMRASDYIITAWDGRKLVGLCAVISNGIQAYVTQLCVTKEYQNRNIGGMLIECVKMYYKKQNHHCHIILHTRSASGFYLKHGFEVDDDNPVVMEIDYR